MRFCLEGWEDGQAVKCWLTGPDRWQTQAADRVTVELQPGVSVVIQQEPQSLTSKRLGVGACVWDGALVLSAYFAAQPPGTFAGVRAVELGAGTGLAGLALARLGAHVTLTDTPRMMGLLRRNIARNWLGPGPSRLSVEDGVCPPGIADVAALEWGTPEGEAAAASLNANGTVGLVIAADCCYPDPAGSVTDPRDFAAAAAGLCGSRTRVLATFEARSGELREALLAAARDRFALVSRLGLDVLSEGFCVDHIELYEFQL